MPQGNFDKISNKHVKWTQYAKKNPVALTATAAIKQNIWIFKPLSIDMSVARYNEGFSFFFVIFFYLNVT